MKKLAVLSFVLLISTITFAQIRSFGLECAKIRYNRKTGEKISSRHENVNSLFEISNKEVKFIIDNVTTVYQVIKEPIYRKSPSGNSIILQCKKSDGCGFTIGVRDNDNENEDEVFIIPDFTVADTEYTVTNYYVYPIQISDLTSVTKKDNSPIGRTEKTTTTVVASANVSKAPTVYIPDANFKAKLISLGLDSNKDGQIQLSEVKDVKTLVLSNSSIADLTGIEAFSSLKTLVCVENKLTSLDVSKNQTLVSLYCGLNKISTLNLAANKQLKDFSCYKCNLSELDLSNNPAVQTVMCSGNPKLKKICVTKEHLATKKKNMGIWEKDAGAVWSTACANRK